MTSYTKIFVGSSEFKRLVFRVYNENYPSKKYLKKCNKDREIR